MGLVPRNQVSGQRSSRPYWHVDAKWVCGLVAMAAMGVGLLFMSLSSLTSPARGIEFSATIVATMFSPKGLDEPGDLTELKRRIAASPTGAVSPIPQFPNATITMADLELSPRELRMKIFRQIVKPIYEKGVGGAAKEFTADPAQQEQFKKDAALLSVFTRQTHETLAGWARTTLIIGLLALAGVAFFSFRWGRLSNPGALLVTVGLPGALIALTLTAKAGADGGPFGPLPPDLRPALGEALRSTYVPALLAGAVMLVAAGVGKIVSGLRAKGRR